jgi:hypothetical protein
MKRHRINPFNETFVAETIPPEQFVSLFSPFLVKDIPDGLALFQPGNVILKGVQGSGKTMLLNLLKPEYRVAYCQAGKDLPIPEQLRSFIGAGINLTRSVAIDFGQRVIELDHFDDMETLPIFFGDFINYWIVEDILTSIDKLTSECDGAIAQELGIRRDEKSWNQFATLLARDRCWFGYLNGIKKFSKLRMKLRGRISTYRAFLNYNLPSIPNEIRRTKTPIGEPVSQTVQALWDSGVVPHSVPFFIRIDQYEELTNLEDWSGKQQLGLRYLEMINKALGTRDPRVSYRIGTRRYGWPERPIIFGISSVLELERDYKLVDIDAILRRKELRRTWAFPGFAADVFERRIRHYGYDDADESLNRFLSRGLSVRQKADIYVREPTDRVFDSDIVPRGWATLYNKLAKEDPLDAKLMEAWVLQNKPAKTSSAPRQPYPWHRTWWRKERIQHALMQLASANRQRMVWAGKDDVTALSGGNILIFVSICQHIWSTWASSNRDQLEASEGEEVATPEVDGHLQAVAIQEASSHWYKKIKERTGRSKQRQRFIDQLGRVFRGEMIQDRKLSYPGHNGFSLRLEDLGSDEAILQFLNECVNYGDLYDAPHTTKTKDRRPRKKWYLNPVLSPHFQLPVSHVKEPMYVTLSTVRKWLQDAERLAEDLDENEIVSDPNAQLELFRETPIAR